MINRHHSGQGRPKPRGAFADTDPLTELPNRAGAQHLVAPLISRAVAHQHNFALAVLSVRRLRRLNRALGYAGAQEVIRQVAARLRGADEDVRLVAHLEGGSFLLAVPQTGDGTLSLAKCRRILDLFDVPMYINDRTVYISLCGGMAIAPQHGENTTDLIDAALRAHEHCRADGHDLKLARQCDIARSRHLIELEADLRQAIDRREFFLLYQPKLSLDAITVVGCEALVRWRHPTRGVIQPGGFIPFAESSGLIRRITLQVLDEVVKAWCHWRDQGCRPINVCVNLSLRDLSDERTVARIRELLSRHGIPGECLTLEITEGWMMQDADYALSLMEQIRTLGVRISVDDFGTGYSSLSQLMRFPADEVKIDRSFVSGADGDLRKRRFLDAVRRISDSIGTSAVAEGAETFYELAVLRRLGFDGAQGYVFSPAVSEDDFASGCLRPGRMPECEAARAALDRMGATLGAT